MTNDLKNLHFTLRNTANSPEHQIDELRRYAARHPLPSLPELDLYVAVFCQDRPRLEKRAVIEVLLELRAEIGRMAMRYAALNEAELLGAFRDAGGDLQFAIVQLADRPEQLAQLVALGADLDGEVGGRSVLAHALAQGAEVRYLLEMGARPKPPLMMHLPPSGFDAERNLATLAEFSANVDEPLHRGTLLLEAIDDKFPNVRRALLLLRLGADPYRPDRRGWTPLHAAVHRRSAELIEHLRGLGASLDAATTRRVHTYRAGTTAANVARARGVAL